jgi:pyruvate dehydrogenase E1 component
VHDFPMLPFYIFYSMFGFQRVGDLIWAAADQRARGFLLGATSGRTTLGGEGLQHQDGTSHLVAATIPNCRAYDPAYAYELAVIVDHGMREMLEAQRDVFYYVTVMNENYAQPSMPAGALENVREGILRGLYQLPTEEKKPQVQLLGAGAIMTEVTAARDLLASDWNISAVVWSVTSFSELQREGLAVERSHRLSAQTKSQQISYVAQCLGKHSVPVIAATDYVRAVPELIRAFIPQRYVTLGTDGFGRSDTRKALREFFEVDRYSIVIAALRALLDEGKVAADVLDAALKNYQSAAAGSAASWER